MLEVTCAIIFKENQLLIAQRGSKMKLALKWEFPGGKIEPGENEEECIKREIFEELNIHIKIERKLTPVLHQYPNFKINLIPFITEYVSGDLELKEHSDHVLVDKHELYKLDWAEADLPVLKEYTAL